MAILIGVMAPQLIKYIEKTNVSNDTQVCDTVRTAIQTAMMDPAVITDPGYTDVSSSAQTNYGTIAAICGQGGDKFTKSVEDSLGVPTGGDIDAFVKNQLKSKGAKDSAINIDINTTSIIVYIPNTDMSGKKQSNAKPNADAETSCVYAGPVASFTF